jgi:PilZ domain/Tetratricopeptide repeat
MDQRMSAMECYEHGLVLKRVGMFLPAIEDFRKATRDPRCAPKAYVQMALCLRATARHEDAIMAFRQALVCETLSAEEQRHILYHLGKALESLGRYAESLEFYGRIRREAPGFLDVTKRIKRLSSGEPGPAQEPQGPWQSWMHDVLERGLELTPHMRTFLEQTGQWVSRQAESLLQQHPLFEQTRSKLRHTVHEKSGQKLTTKRLTQPTKRTRSFEHRRYRRVPIRLQSHFSSKGKQLTGQGELRDLSPWGCRVTSTLAVSVGANLECCIYPKDAANPFIIEGATVRWISPHEFGVSFTRVRPSVQRQIAQICGTQAA